MNRDALSARSLNSTPPLTAELFATMPTVSPSIRPNPTTSSAANSGLTSKKRVVVDEPVDDVVDVERLALALGHRRRGSAAAAGSSGS